MIKIGVTGYSILRPSWDFLRGLNSLTLHLLLIIRVHSCVVLVAAAVWRGGHERDGHPHGTEKEIDGIPEKSETKHGRYSERFDMELNHGVCTSGPSVNIIVCATTVFVGFLKTKLNVTESIYYDSKHHYS